MMAVVDRRVAAHLLVVGLGVLLFMLLSTHQVRAAEPMRIESFAVGLSNSQAGGHPDLNVDMAFALTRAGGVAGAPNACVVADCLVVAGGAPKDVIVDLPAGLIGNSQNVPVCTSKQLMNFARRCPVASQVGVITVRTIQLGTVTTFVAEVYNMPPERGEVAKLGFRFANAVPSYISVQVRDGDYALTSGALNAFDGLPVFGVDLDIWGVPADPVHDPQRLCFAGAGVGCSAGVDPTPFMIAPAVCGREAVARLRVRSYQGAATGGGWTTAETAMPQLHGCERQQFDPEIGVSTDTTERGAPLGFGLDLAIPQPSAANPTGLATPPLKDAVVTLPQGVALSPSSVDGLGACSDAQLNIGSDKPVECPDSSKIGTVRVVSPLIREELTGSVFVGTQLSDDPASGDMFRIALQVGNEERGIDIKLPGRLEIDPTTHQIKAVFRNNPELAFSLMQLRFKGGPRAPLALPQQCGTYTTSAELTGWGMSTTSVVTSDFVVTHNGSGAPCPLGFSPSFTAGSTTPSGGADTSFTLTFGRDDNDQDLGALAVNLPKGLTGRVANVPLCGDVAANLGVCGEASRIGTVMSGAGPGSNPFYLPGRVYFTGPYKGAPFGMSIVVPAVAGPYNLGTVVVRAAVFVDQTTAQLRVVSDPLPTSLKGVPLRVRSVNVLIDKRDFMINPTNCEPSRVEGTLTSAAGASAAVGQRFQVSDCATLPFRPRLDVKVGSLGRTGRDSTTPLQATLRMPRGLQANQRSVQLTLPETINARLPMVRRACTMAEFQANRCEQARIGEAIAVTPLLRDPLKGPVYFVRNPARRLPDVVTPLRGQVAFDLTGRVAIIGRRFLLRTTFDTVPDVPVSMFRLKLYAGRQAAVGVVRNLCTRASRRERANIEFIGQNNELVEVDQRLRIAGCGRRAARRTTARGGRRAGRRSASRRGGRRTRR